MLAIGASATGFYWTPLAVGLVGLAWRGFAVDPLGMTITIAVGGAVLAFEPRLTSGLGDARVYTLLIGLVGWVNLLPGTFAGEELAGSQGDPAARYRLLG